MKKVVITGGAGDLGQAIAEAFSTADWSVSAPGRDALDVTDEDSIQNFFQNRDLDLLVCNAGIIRDVLLHRLDEETWDRVLKANYGGSAACATAALTSMRRRSCGHIVFISSYSALHPPLGQSAYATAKAALLGLTRELASRHGAENIRVNAVIPGFLETRMTASVSSKRREEVLASHSLGRFNTPAQVGDFLRFLHEKLPHTSGQTFNLDSR